MSFFRKLFYITVAIVFVLVGIKINDSLKDAPLPVLEDVWWGPGQAVKVDQSIRPFKIDVPEKVLDDLNQRLKSARPFTPPLEGVQQQYGMNTRLLTEIVDFWRNNYNWREREKFLNQYPQFKTNIQGLDIHFIHVKPAKTNGLKVLPLLLVHGWPGSFREFYDVIPLLTTPKQGQKFVFELIIPSLPGYGFSQSASKPGLGVPQAAVIFKNLMKRLGFEKYYVQGGDWGAMIVSTMATLYTDQILGVHSNMCAVDSHWANLKIFLGSIYPPLIVDKKHESKMYPLMSAFEFIMLEMGYLHLQATKPDTVGVGLNDSPVGLAAYILEKFTTWTNPEWKNREDGGLKEKYSYADLLDNVMIYWVSNSITTSARMYAETINKATTELGLGSFPILVPSACARFPHELAYQPDCILKMRYKNLVQATDMDDGGHFAAFEVPEKLAGDIWTAIHKMEKFHEVKSR